MHKPTPPHTPPSGAEPLTTVRLELFLKTFLLALSPDDNDCHQDQRQNPRDNLHPSVVNLRLCLGLLPEPSQKWHETSHGCSSRRPFA